MILKDQWKQHLAGNMQDLLIKSELHLIILQIYYFYTWIPAANHIY